MGSYCFQDRRDRRLAAEKGVTWEAFTGFGPYPTAHNPAGGRGLIDEMVKIAEAQGIEVITECKGEKLVLDDQGAVVGIVAETSDKVITFNTASVVLATGGISANSEMVKQYSPKVDQSRNDFCRGGRLNRRWPDDGAGSRCRAV